MEDVKEPFNSSLISFLYLLVSILVLMEDVKEQLLIGLEMLRKLCFNPCFNGRCKRTQHLNFQSGKSTCFNPCFNGRCKRTLVEVGTYVHPAICFNPCFNGRCKRTINDLIKSIFSNIVSILVLMEDVKELYNNI